MQMPGTVALVQGFCVCWFAGYVSAAAPVLYSQAAYQSPTHGGADDLVQLSGYGLSATDSVVYAAIMNTAVEPVPPADIPESAQATAGYAPIVSANDVPYSLVVRLPGALVAEQSYALWVRTIDGEWSRPVRINDLRPLWISPSFIYSTISPAGLPRSLKLVGRNVNAGPHQVTQVALRGPQSLILTALPSGSVVDSYVARVDLPPALTPGHYRVAASRDGTSWVDLKDQSLEVRADPATRPTFSIDEQRFGDCHANDGRDTTRCVIRAIAAARDAGGGTVRFGPGAWTLSNSAVPGVSAGDGILVPEGVTLRGMGPALTRIVRTPEWNAPGPAATFTLQGRNVIAGLTFQDKEFYTPASRPGPMLQIGENSDRLWARTHRLPEPVRDIVITDNRFDRTGVAIADGGLAIDGLFVTYNEFGTYGYQLELDGNRYNMVSSFRVDNSVIAFNTFKPGSFIDEKDHLGSIASELGASNRVDFSDNIADGAATEFLYSPADAHGWRAGFFFHMNNNHELLLVSNNTATCTGDKIGDGEAIALDNNANTFAFDSMRPVQQADRSTVTVEGPLAARQNERDLIGISYYIGHWVQVGDGPGKGQARKITGYRIDPSTGLVQFTVNPLWDVVPVKGLSRISVGREFWQAFVVGNHIDHRTPLCRKSNRSRSAGGSIAIWAQLADSVVAGNELHDTDGVVFHETYQSPILTCPGCGSETFFQTAFDIRDNLVVGRYDDVTDCAASGITGWISAAPDSVAPPPTLGYGISISGNRILRADNALGGAISIAQGWFAGPQPHAWPIVQGALIQHNQLEGRTGPLVGRNCKPDQRRRGISFPGEALSWNSVLYANTCSGITTPLGHGGRNNVRVCTGTVAHSCECPPIAAVSPTADSSAHP